MYDDRTVHRDCRAAHSTSGNWLHALRRGAFWHYLLWSLACLVLTSLLPAQTGTTYNVSGQRGEGAIRRTLVFKSGTGANVRVYWPSQSPGVTGSSVWATVAGTNIWTYTQAFEMDSPTVQQTTETTTTGASYTFQYNTTGSAPPWREIEVYIPPTNVRASYASGNNSYYQVNLPPMEVSIAADGTATINDPLDTRYKGPNPLQELAGKTIAFPYMSDAEGKVTLDIAGQQYELDVGKGLNMLDFKVPENWDGTIGVNGQKVALSSNLTMTGSGEFTEFWANPYGLNFAAGRPWTPQGQYNFPQGSDPRTLMLPPGVTPGNQLPLPPGVTLANSGQIGDYLKWKVTQSSTSGGTTTTTTTDYTVKGGGGGKPGTPLGGSTGSTGGAGSTTPKGNTSGGTGGSSGGSSSDEDVGSVIGGWGPGDDPVDAPEDVGARLQQLQDAIKGKIEGFNPLGTSGSIPMSTTIPFTMDFGRLGTITKTIDLSVPPWPYIRAAWLVAITLMLGNSLIKRLTI